MITSTLLRPVPRRTPMIVGVFCFRYDAALVPALISNITPMVHGIVTLDDRNNDSTGPDEDQRRNLLHVAARAMGADWILAVDPDERFEGRLAERIGDLTAAKDGKTLWVFNLREMMSTSAYRSDGLWGYKSQMRLYPAAATIAPLRQELHGGWVRYDPSNHYVPTGLNLYHLRHATPERLQLRRDTYAAADPDRRFQYIGYDYLTDTRGAQLKQVAPLRGFDPPHIEDGELWAAPVPMPTGPLRPDPLAARLYLMADMCRQRGAEGASYVAHDIWNADPDDTDMQMVAASLALCSGRAQDALQLTAGADGPDGPGLAQVIRAGAYAALGDRDQAATALRAAVDQIGPSPFLAHLQQDLSVTRQDFTAPDANWRRWAGDGVHIHDGPRNGSGAGPSQLAVIIIGFQAPATLAQAVQSVRSQSAQVEIVVVNSGGGDVRKVLGPDLDHIRLVQTETPLFIGAARNIGIETSRAPFVAFLAADCIALPGWVDGRLARHLAGAQMVSTAVETSRPGTVIGTMAEWLVFPLRGPTLGEDEAIHYGRSFCRTMFAKAGFFAPELRVGEDTEFHRRADMIVEPVWAPEISVKHDDPASILALLLDLRQRGLRAASHLRPGRVPQTGPDWVTRQMKVRNQKIRQSLRGRPGLGGVRRVQLGLALALGLKSFETGLRRADKTLAKAIIAANATQDAAATDIELAIGQAQIAVTLVPQNPAYRTTLGQLLLKRGRPADLATAIGHLQTALAIAPTSAHALWLAATALHKDGQSAAALNLCEQAVRSAPAASTVVLVTARVANWAKRPHLALCLAQKALAADPASVPAHQFLEALHRTAGRSALAEKRKKMLTCLQDAKAARTINN